MMSILRFASISADQLRYRGDIVFESPGVQTALLIHRGVDPYSKSVYDAPPFNLTLYPPLYFAAVSAAPGFLQSPFVTGRVVSLGFALCAAALLIWPLRSKERFLFGLIGIGWFFMFSPVWTNAAFFRMETMALFWSAAGLAVLLRYPPTLTVICAAAVLECLAVLTKQSYIAAGLTCAIYLLRRSPARAARFSLMTGGIVGAVVWVLNHQSGGGFLWCILKAPQNPLRGWRFVENWLEIDTAAFNVLLALSVFACGSMIRSSNRQSSEARSEEDWRERLIILYFLVSWVILIAGIGKLGASTNYFIEPLYASIWVVLIWAARRADSSKKALGIGLACIAAALFWDVAMSRNDPAIRLEDRRPTYEECQAVRSEVERLGPPASPKILNLATNRVSLIAGWDLYLNDPFLYAILWNSGTLPPQSMLDSLEQGFFDVVILERGARPELIPRPSPLGEIYMKIFERYEFKSEGMFAYYVRRRPAGSPS